ncbi:MAG: hypothetical protein AABM66_08405 [Actinomycetota bacterium]
MATAVAAVSMGAGCGGGDGDAGETGVSPAPAAADFPAANGNTLTQMLRSSGAQQSNLVVSPTAAVYERGENRFGFGVFTVSREQVGDAQVAIYAAPSGGGRAVGPFPARIESLAVKPQFESQTTDLDPDSAKLVYITSMELDREGNWDLVAMFREGSGYTATFVPTIQVGGSKAIPTVGERPPRIHTPTAADVGGDVAQIDTRSPPDDMHKVDFADVLGKEPVVLLFATPALCESRVCGPVVDVAEQVDHEAGGGVSFIHMEVFNDNNASEGYRPQMLEFGLQTEPWLFVIDREGIVRSRLQGAFSASELESAVRQVAG